MEHEKSEINNWADLSIHKSLASLISRIILPFHMSIPDLQQLKITEIVSTTLLIISGAHLNH